MEKLKGKGNKVGTDFTIYYEEELGRGAYGIVCKGYSKSRDCIVAIKKLTGTVEQIWKKNPTLKREVEVMSKLKHKNILQLIECVETTEGIYIITQYCDGGDLKDQLKALTKLSQITAFKYFVQIVQGMAYVNRQKIFHRDIKPENIMLTTAGVIKIGDFGLAREIIGNDIAVLKAYTAKCTPLYAAPNIILGQEFSAKVDVWSTGVLIIELLTGQNIFKSARNFFHLTTLHKQLETKPYVLQGNYHEIFKRLLPKMLEYYQQKRITFAEVEQELNKQKEKIESSMDSSTIVQHSNIKKIKIKNNVYQTEKKQGNQNQTMANMKQKQLDQQFYHQLLRITRFVDFLYNRNLLFKETYVKLNQTVKYPLAGVYKYTLMFVQDCLFIKGLEQILDFVKSDVLSFPDGRTITISQLSAKNKAQVKQLLDNYIEQVDHNRNLSFNTVKAIYAQLFKKQYVDAYKSTFMTKYAKLFDSLKNVYNGDKFESLDFYQETYKSLMKEQAKITNYTLDEATTRIYYASLKLINIRTLINEKRFQESELLNKFKQTINKEDVGKLANEIKNM